MPEYSYVKNDRKDLEGVISISFEYLYFNLHFLPNNHVKFLRSLDYRDAAFASGARLRSGVAAAVWLLKRPPSSRSTRLAAATVCGR